MNELEFVEKGLETPVETILALSILCAMIAMVLYVVVLLRRVFSSSTNEDVDDTINRRTIPIMTDLAVTLAKDIPSTLRQMTNILERIPDRIEQTNLSTRQYMDKVIKKMSEKDEAIQKSVDDNKGKIEDNRGILERIELAISDLSTRQGQLSENQKQILELMRQSSQDHAQILRTLDNEALQWLLSEAEKVKKDNSNE